MLFFDTVLLLYFIFTLLLLSSKNWIFKKLSSPEGTMVRIFSHPQDHRGKDSDKEKLHWSTRSKSHLSTRTQLGTRTTTEPGRNPKKAPPPSPPPLKTYRNMWNAERQQDIPRRPHWNWQGGRTQGHWLPRRDQRQWHPSSQRNWQPRDSLATSKTKKHPMRNNRRKAVARRKQVTGSGPNYYRSGTHQGPTLPPA